MAKRLGNGESKPTHEEIAQRARALYEQSGCVQGRDMDNWLQAEAQLMSMRKATGTESRQLAMKEMPKASLRQ